MSICIELAAEVKDVAQYAQKNPVFYCFQFDPAACQKKDPKHN